MQARRVERRGFLGTEPTEPMKSACPSNLLYDGMLWRIGVLYHSTIVVHYDDIVVYHSILHHNNIFRVQCGILSYSILCYVML